MGFEKGNTIGKGRPAGSVNKPNELKQFLINTVNDNQERFLKEIKELEGKNYVDAMFALMEYVQPKLARTEVITAVVEKPRRIGWTDDDDVVQIIED